MFLSLSFFSGHTYNFFSGGEGERRRRRRRRNVF
jgi:hypothetical protein